MPKKAPVQELRNYMHRSPVFEEGEVRENSGDYQCRVNMAGVDSGACMEYTTVREVRETDNQQTCGQMNTTVDGL